MVSGRGNSPADVGSARRVRSKYVSNLLGSRGVMIPFPFPPLDVMRQDGCCKGGRLVNGDSR